MNAWTEYGKRYICEVMAGKAGPISHMYIEYGDDPPSLNAVRNNEYFASIPDGKRTGYKRIPIHSTKIDADGTITFTSILAPGDIDSRQRVTVQCATLAVSSGMSSFDDKFILVSAFEGQQYIPGKYMTVLVTVRLETT